MKIKIKKSGKQKYQIFTETFDKRWYLWDFGNWSRQEAQDKMRYHQEMFKLRLFQLVKEGEKCLSSDEIRGITSSTSDATDAKRSEDSTGSASIAENPSAISASAKKKGKISVVKRAKKKGGTR